MVANLNVAKFYGPTYTWRTYNGTERRNDVSQASFDGSILKLAPKGRICAR